MERELLEAFEAAEKAAAAAAAGDDNGSADVDRCVDCLKRMRKMQVTTQDLVATQVGKRIRSLTKHPKPRIQAFATDLFKFWKNIVIEETNKDSKKSSSSSEEQKTPKSEIKSEKPAVIKTEIAVKSDQPEIYMQSNSESIKVSEKLSGMQSVKIEKTMKAVSRSSTTTYETIKAEEKRISISKKPMIPIGPPKLTSMVKCNDPLRDKLRELLLESFSKVLSEAEEDERDEVRNILDEITACDPIRVAVTVESAMFEKLGRSNGTHKVKYRSIMFNLKDSKNTDLRRRVLLGHIVPERLINMTAEEMASDERKLSNKQIQEKALLECERAGAPKATTDQFKCGRCGQRKCTYYQLQTRSADEPMTTFVTCVNCNNHWKFC